MNDSELLADRAATMAWFRSCQLTPLARVDGHARTVVDHPLRKMPTGA